MDIILHHYPTSPWAEVVRLALGWKGARWGSVEIPVICPKPELVPLTGGYVRTPVLQMGADMYCDTLAIMAALEPLPGPTLYPVPLGSEHRTLAMEAGGATFLAAVGAAMGDLPMNGMEAFWADRQQRFGMNPDGFRAMVPGLKQAFAAHLARLERMLADGRAFLGGESPGHGDFAHYMLPWFAARGRPVADVAPALSDWAGRVAAIGHGAPVAMSAADAIVVAAAAEPRPASGGVDPESSFEAGQTVAISQDGTNDPAVTGSLARLDARSISLLRTDALAGNVAVHFPREGQILRAA